MIYNGLTQSHRYKLNMLHTAAIWGSATMHNGCDDEQEIRSIMSELPWYYRLQFYLRVMMIVVRRTSLNWDWAIAAVILIYLTIAYPLLVVGSCVIAILALLVYPLMDLADRLPIE
jgi:hypothetical protein